MSKSYLPPAPAWVRLMAKVIPRLPAGRYKAIHRLCRHPPSAFLMYMPEEMGGYAFHCDLRDTISREVCFTGYYEPQETALVRSILRPGMSFVDVGANWGYYTLLAASLVGSEGRVLSIEPDPRLFPLLQENVACSELNQVELVQMAAANKPGILPLAGYAEDGSNYGTSRIIADHSKDKNVFQVSSDSLDRILLQHGLLSIDLMKMDIEGAEAFAIAGLAESLAERKVKRLLLELHPAELEQHGFSVTAIIQKLSDAGYRALTIDHSPSATRQTAYKREKNIKALLRPFNPSERYDSWPHQLWLAPDIE